MFDTQKYGDMYTVRKKNERMFILRTLIELNKTIQGESNSRLLFFAKNDIGDVVKRITEVDPTVGAIYYDGGSSLDDVKIKTQLTKIKKIKLHLVNSEDNMIYTWRRKKSSHRIIDPRKFDYALYRTRTINDFYKRVEYFPLPPKLCFTDKLVTDIGEIRGNENINDYARAFIEKSSSGNKYGGRNQAKQLLAKTPPVSFGFIYPFLRFGVIDPNEFIMSPNFTRMDYTKYVFMRRMYESNSLNISVNGVKKLTRIYKSHVSKTPNAENEIKFNKCVRLLRKRGIISDKIFDDILRISVDDIKKSWGTIIGLFRESLVGYDMSIVYVRLYSSINSIKYGINDDLMYTNMLKL